MSLSVIIFAEDYLPNIGGIASHVHNLATYLVKAGLKVEVISTRKNMPQRNIRQWKCVRKKIDGVDVLEIPFIYSPRNILTGFQMKYRYARIVLKEARRIKADVFHWHNIYFDPEVAKHIKNRGLGMVFTNHSSQFLQGIRNSDKFASIKDNLLYADYIITPSTELKEETVKCGIESDRVFFISNGVNVNDFSPAESERTQFRKKIGLTDEIAVFCPRRVVPKCGIIYLAKALKHLQTGKKVKVFFTGLSGGNRTWRDLDYEKQVIDELEQKKFKDNIEAVMLPQVANNEMGMYYRAMDVCILPSLLEATSISGLEAMATGLALIGTNVGGIPEIIKDGYNGLLVNKENEIELARAMDRVIDDDKLRCFLSENARKRAVEEFSWSKITQKTINIYQKSLALHV